MEHMGRHLFVTPKQVELYGNVRRGEVQSGLCEGTWGVQECGVSMGTVHGTQDQRA